MIKVVTYFQTLIRLAREEAIAVKSGDEEQIKKAKTAHEDYKRACLKSDEIII